MNAATGVLKTPTVSHTKLQNIVNDLYKGTTNPARIGTGTTMDAVRYELEMGDLVFGRSHIQKAEDAVRGLEKILGDPGLGFYDRLVGQSILDLQDALRGAQ